MAVDQATLDAIIAGLTTTPAAKPKPWCRARCGERLDPALAGPDGSGLHLLCTEPQTPPPAPEPLPIPQPQPAPTALPQSTVAELRQVLINYDADRPRSRQRRLGPSELGTPCTAQIVRKLIGAPRRPVTAPTWAPFQGTAVHTEMEQVVAYWNQQAGRERWLAEDDLHIDPGMTVTGATPAEGGLDIAPISGHGDAYDTEHHMVVDWKHVGKTALNKLRAAKKAGKPADQQVSAEYRTQAHLYGMGHANKGRPVRFVRLVLLARDWQYDTSDEWTEPYNPQVAAQAIASYYQAHELIEQHQLLTDRNRITEISTAPSGEACKWCPFNRPGQPSTWDGCAGDTSSQAKVQARFTDGLIA